MLRNDGIVWILFGIAGIAELFLKHLDGLHCSGSTISIFISQTYFFDVGSVH